MKYITPNDDYNETRDNFTNRYILRKMLSEHVPRIPLTGEEVIKATNVSVNTLKSYWSGRRTIPDDFIEKLADTFGFNTDYFIQSLTETDDELREYVASDMPKEVSALFKLFETLGFGFLINCSTNDGRDITVSLKSIRTFSFDKQCIYIKQEKKPVIAYSVHLAGRITDGRPESYSYFLNYIKKMLEVLSLGISSDFSSYKTEMTTQEQNLIYQQQAFYYLATDNGASLHDYKLSKNMITKSVPRLSEKSMLGRLKIISKTYTPVEAAEILYPVTF